MSEHDEQVALFDYIQRLDRPELEWLHAIPNGGHRHKAIAIKLKREGVKAGVWDVFLPLPRHGYHGLYIEMKYANNKLTENQQKFEKYLQDHGYKTSVCYDWMEAVNSILEYVDGV